MGIVLVVPGISFEEKNIDKVNFSNPPYDYPKEGLTFMVDAFENESLVKDGKLYSSIGGEMFNSSYSIFDGNSIVVNSDVNNPIVSESPYSYLGNIGTNDFTFVLGFNYTREGQCPYGEWTLIQSSKNVLYERNNRYSFKILKESNQFLIVYYTDDYKAVYFPTPLTEGFHLLMLIRSNGTFYLYDKGVLVDTVLDTDKINFSSYGTCYTSIFGEVFPSDMLKNYNGKLYVTSVYNRALNQDEIIASSYYYMNLYNQ